MSLTAPPRAIPSQRTHPRAPQRRRSRGRASVLGLLVALTIGAGIAIAFVLVATPGLASSPAPSSPAVTAPPAPTATVRGVVIASASCLDRGAHDMVELRGPDGVVRTLPLDACGSQAGAIVPVDLRTGDPLAHLAGTGTTTATSASGTHGDASPTTRRLAVTLTAVAGLGTAGLLVAVGRAQMIARRRPRAGRPGARRPAGGTAAQ